MCKTVCFMLFLVQIKSIKKPHINICEVPESRFIIIFFYLLLCLKFIAITQSINKRINI